MPSLLAAGISVQILDDHSGIPGHVFYLCQGFDLLIMGCCSSGLSEWTFLTQNSFHQCVEPHLSSSITAHLVLTRDQSNIESTPEADAPIVTMEK